MSDDEKTRVWNPDGSPDSPPPPPRSSSGDEGYTVPYEEEGEKTEFVKKPKRAESLAWVVVFKGKKNLGKFDLEGDDYLIGRAEYCDIRLRDQDQELSRLHGRIRFDETTRQFTYYDCGSANGSLLNGEEIARKDLKDNDRLSIGPFELVFKRL